MTTVYPERHNALASEEGLVVWISTVDDWGETLKNRGSRAAPVSEEFECVLVRANQVWGPDAARIWLTSANLTFIMDPV